MAAKFTLGRHIESRQIYNIQTVKHDQRLNFECIECGKTLKCVLNDQNMAKHFRHKSVINLNCNPTPETLLHKTAKKIIQENKQIQLPLGHGMFNYIEAIPELSLNNRRPDITLLSGENIMYVEIVVTNEVSNDKQMDYELFNANFFVINLKDYPKLFDTEQLRKDVMNNTENRYFLKTSNVTVPETLVKESENLRMEDFIKGTGIVLLATICFKILKKIFKKDKQKRINPRKFRRY